MLELLNYLRENIFFNIPVDQLVLTYCKKLVEWQQFQDLQEFLYNSKWLPFYEIDRKNLIYNLLKTVLKELYEDEALIFDEETTAYIRKILTIDHHPETNEIIIRQEAKLELVQLFSEWSYTIRLNNLQIMVNQWYVGHQQA